MKDKIRTWSLTPPRQITMILVFLLPLKMLLFVTKLWTDCMTSWTNRIDLENPIILCVYLLWVSYLWIVYGLLVWLRYILSIFPLIAEILSYIENVPILENLNIVNTLSCQYWYKYWRKDVFGNWLPMSLLLICVYNPLKTTLCCWILSVWSKDGESGYICGGGTFEHWGEMLSENQYFSLTPMKLIVLQLQWNW